MQETNKKYLVNKKAFSLFVLVKQKLLKKLFLSLVYSISNLIQKGLK